MCVADEQACRWDITLLSRRRNVGWILFYPLYTANAIFFIFIVRGSYNNRYSQKKIYINIYRTEFKFAINT